MARWTAYGPGGYRPDRPDKGIIAEGDQPDPPVEPPAGDWPAIRDRLNRSSLPAEMKAIVGALLDANEKVDQWRRFPERRGSAG